MVAYLEIQLWEVSVICSLILDLKVLMVWIYHRSMEPGRLLPNIKLDLSFAVLKSYLRVLKGLKMVLMFFLAMNFVM